jgi:hypothetical protein
MQKERYGQNDAKRLFEEVSDGEAGDAGPFFIGPAPVRMLNDDFAGLKKDFQWDFTVLMPLNMSGTKLLERGNNSWQKRGLISKRDHKQRIRTVAS